MMDLRKLVPAVVVVFSFLAAGAALYLILSPAPPAKKGELEPLLRSLDAAISAGAFPTARDLLEGVKNLPSTEDDLLRLLKRAFEVSSASGDYGTMSRLSLKALSAAGGSARIRAIMVFACLRGGRLAEAEKLIARGSLPAAAGDLLRGEAILRRGGKWEPADPLFRDLLTLEQKQTTEAFTDAAHRTGDARLSLDAALLSMESGSAAKAQSIAGGELGDAAFDEPAAAISYDGGDFKTAIERLKRLDADRPDRADVALILADSCQALGMAADAERWLLHALPLAPALTWTAYSNLAYYAGARGDTVLDGRRLKDGLAFFPQSRELRLSQAQLEARLGETDAAISILSKLAAENPEDGEVALLLLDQQAPGLSPEEYRARLWKAFDRVPADKAIFSALSTALIASHDWEGAGIAIDQHAAAGGAAGQQLLLAEGMIAAMRGSDAAASDAFRRAAAIAGDGMARYDLALVLLRRGDVKAAIAELGTAADEYARRGNPAERSDVLSRMQMLTGSARLLDGDESGARDAFLRSLALNPHNLRAALLLRKLEAGRQQ
jgi:Flp pilus assembly protein TadD